LFLQEQIKDIIIMYWYELIPLRYEITCVGMMTYLYGMK
jgi:hypothetical protein